MQFAETLDALTGAMRAEAERAYPREACGFVVAQGKKAIFLPTRNAAESNEQFLIEAEDYGRAEDAGEIVAIWHSHPETDATPSELDVAGCNMSELPWIISSVRRGEGGFVHADPLLLSPGNGRTDLIGRPYVFGVFDCYSLIRDFYIQEFRIRLDPFMQLRIRDWWRSGQDILGDNWAEQGFVEVTDGTFQHGDALCMAMHSDIPNHVAIYVTGDIILHHLVNRLSRREPFTPYWYSRVKLHLRHVSKC